MVKPARWIDTIALLFSIIVIVLAFVGLGQTEMFSLTFSQDQNLTWHLIRSAGITAYILLTVSVIWGLALSSRIVKDWSPGVLSMLMHSTISWLALALGLIHALLLLVDKYFSFQISDLFIPFTGPYRPLAVGLGTLAFWITLVVTLSFSVKRFIGHRLWKYIHFGSFLSFGLITAHGLLAGTDAEHLGFRMLVTVGVALVLVFLSIRVGRVAQTTARSAAR
jgi:predicted ferric reductase